MYLMGLTVSLPNSYVEVLTSSTSDCGYLVKAAIQFNIIKKSNHFNDRKLVGLQESRG